MNKNTLVERLREQLKKGLSIDGLAAMIETCSTFLKAHSHDADAEIVGVFALRGILLRAKRKTEDEAFPLAVRLTQIESAHWPLIERCLQELENADGEAVRYSVLNACVREIFSA